MKINQIPWILHVQLYYEMICLEKWSRRAFLSTYIWLLQVFTNSDKAHVEEALHRLGLQGCFEGVICFEILNHCNGLRQFQNSTLFPDETSRNIASGKAAGFHTVIVRRRTCSKIPHQLSFVFKRKTWTENFLNFAGWQTDTCSKWAH
jgi:FMN phosphatase YigB (HAD superfamily)